jgi:hypothetical protein
MNDALGTDRLVRVIGAIEAIIRRAQAGTYEFSIGITDMMRCPDLAT